MITPSCGCVFCDLLVPLEGDATHRTRDIAILCPLHFICEECEELRPIAKLSHLSNHILILCEECEE